MWYGFVDLCFSEKFKKYSEIGKKSRGHLLHPHTSGSQSFAIKRDKFEKENQREPGPIEWFQETHQTKDKTYHNVITQQFMDTAMKVVQHKTNSSNVIFSKSTMDAESYTYKKLMGDEKYGRVRGFGTGVYSNDMHDQYVRNQCDTCSAVLQKMQVMEKWFESFCSKKENRQDGKNALSDEDEDFANLRDDETGLRGFSSSQSNLRGRSEKDKYVKSLGDNGDTLFESPTMSMKVSNVRNDSRVSSLSNSQKKSQHVKNQLNHFHKKVGNTSSERQDVLKDTTNMRNTQIFSTDRENGHNGKKNQNVIDQVTAQVQNGEGITLPHKFSFNPSSFSKINKDEAMYGENGHLGCDIGRGQIPLQLSPNCMSRRVVAPSMKQCNQEHKESVNFPEHTSIRNEEVLEYNGSYLSSVSKRHQPFELRNQHNQNIKASLPRTTCNVQGDVNGGYIGSQMAEKLRSVENDSTKVDAGLRFPRQQNLKVDFPLKSIENSSYKEDNQLIGKQSQSSKVERDILTLGTLNFDQEVRLKN